MTQYVTIDVLPERDLVTQEILSDNWWFVVKVLKNGDLRTQYGHNHLTCEAAMLAASMCAATLITK